MRSCGPVSCVALKPRLVHIWIDALKSFQLALWSSALLHRLQGQGESLSSKIVTTEMVATCSKDV